MKMEKKTAFLLSQSLNQTVVKTRQHYGNFQVLTEKIGRSLVEAWKAMK